jgi:hypothetical protein
MTKRETIQLAISALLHHTYQTRPLTATELVLADLETELAKPEPEPVAWRWLLKNGEPDSDRCFRLPLPDKDITALAESKEFPRYPQALYRKEDVL